MHEARRQFVVEVMTRVITRASQPFSSYRYLYKGGCPNTAQPTTQAINRKWCFTPCTTPPAAATHSSTGARRARRQAWVEAALQPVARRQTVQQLGGARLQAAPRRRCKVGGGGAAATSSSSCRGRCACVRQPPTRHAPPTANLCPTRQLTATRRLLMRWQHARWLQHNSYHPGACTSWASQVRAVRVSPRPTQERGAVQAALQLT
jgi:hypothetical protein